MFEVGRPIWRPPNPTCPGLHSGCSFPKMNTPQASKQSVPDPHSTEVFLYIQRDTVF